MSEQVQIPVDSVLCHDAEAVLRKVGFSTAGAVEVFLHRVVVEGRIPHDYEVPNAETLEAMRDIENGSVYQARGAAELLRMLNEDD